VTTVTLAPERRVTQRPMVSPLRYPGGKGALYSRVRWLIRTSGLAGCTYVEPYAGGAGAGLSLLVTGQVDRVVINDLDPAIAAFWKTLVADPQSLITQIKNVKLSVTEWKRQRKLYSARGGGDIEKLGFATFYLNRTNHSGVLNGGPIGGLKQTGVFKIDARFNRAELAERVRILGLYADQIQVSCDDGKRIIQRYGNRSNTFIYADPPYFEKAGSLYMNTFVEDEHAALSVTLNAMADKAWLLTYDDVPQVDVLYGGRRRRKFELNYSAHRVARATEIAVLSDSVADVEDGWVAALDRELKPGR
jgi:DNA adenine methylase